MKKIKTTEATDGGAVSKGKGKADGGKENKTNWDGIKWNELGQTKDLRYIPNCVNTDHTRSSAQTVDQEI